MRVHVHGGCAAVTGGLIVLGMADEYCIRGEICLFVCLFVGPK